MKTAKLFDALTDMEVEIGRRKSEIEQVMNEFTRDPETRKIKVELSPAYLNDQATRDRYLELAEAGVYLRNVQTHLKKIAKLLRRKAVARPRRQAAPRSSH